MSPSLMSPQVPAFEAWGEGGRQQRLPSPAQLQQRLPLGAAAAARLAAQRADIAAQLAGVAASATRLVVVVGPCSIHDVVAARDYAQRLQQAQQRWQDSLLLVMRTYFDKPRSTVGWRGLLHDPQVDGRFDLPQGLQLVRQLLLDIGALGLPTACEFLDPLTPCYLADTICWGAIGARTAESQLHRALASGLPMPVGFKNSTQGSVQVAIDAVVAAAQPHSLLSIDSTGHVVQQLTRGNPHGHIILRGGSSGPNYDAASIAKSQAQLVAAQLRPRLMVDVSHGNSTRQPAQQLQVALQVAAALATAPQPIAAVMLESFLLEGRQAPQPAARWRYGQSITDACLSWEATETALAALAAAMQQRAKWHAV